MLHRSSICSLEMEFFLQRDFPYSLLSNKEFTVHFAHLNEKILSPQDSPRLEYHSTKFSFGDFRL